MTDRVPCPDPRCLKSRATEEDYARHGEEFCTGTAPCRACRELCWLDRIGAEDAHYSLPPWETWAPAAIRAAVEGEREACLKIVAVNRRQIELSPGVGEQPQKYGLATCDDIAAAIRGRKEGA